ncbi:FadR/GntR family transcriptional regulator [Arsenicicoccus sp. oral taxon 190]|uniref:FadR/GntR family transcriptional regulator n=1 Tax=Arsenicicoccus sp. oral taxon 190 TaxID=1658671 RepID=UPI00067A2A38|nr:FCD domain-containing protein [Arsenicicoccus sp. oral taxon 190]AKT51547.1 hypothetical protein ADJ73_09950 [Arsenicicoccus sp. oral taxon 190]
MKAYESVIHHVESGILDGSLKVGSHLPPERDLAMQLGVSRSAVREAIRALEAQGVVASAVGAGKDAGTRITDRRTRALSRLLRLHVALAKYPVDEVVEARVALERSSVVLAARHLHADQQARLREILDRMADPAVSQDEFNELDTAFHVVMAEVGRNDLMTDMTVAVRESLRRPILDAERSLADWAAFRAELQQHHEAIYEAVVAKDEGRAADLVDAHIRAAYAILPITLGADPQT